MAAISYQDKSYQDRTYQDSDCQSWELSDQECMVTLNIFGDCEEDTSVGIPQEDHLEDDDDLVEQAVEHSPGGAAVSKESFRDDHLDLAPAADGVRLAKPRNGIFLRHLLQQNVQCQVNYALIFNSFTTNK